MSDQTPRELIAELRKMSVAIYLATDEAVADDVSRIGRSAADALETALADNERLRGIIAEADDALGDIAHPRWNGGDKVERLTRVVNALAKAVQS